jgi:hypothetical protein
MQHGRARPSPPHHTARQRETWGARPDFRTADSASRRQRCPGGANAGPRCAVDGGRLAGTSCSAFWRFSPRALAPFWPPGSCPQVPCLAALVALITPPLHGSPPASARCCPLLSAAARAATCTPLRHCLPRHSGAPGSGSPPSPPHRSSAAPARRPCPPAAQPAVPAGGHSGTVLCSQQPSGPAGRLAAPGGCSLSVKHGGRPQAAAVGWLHELRRCAAVVCGCWVLGAPPAARLGPAAAVELRAWRWRLMTAAGLQTGPLHRPQFTGGCVFVGAAGQGRGSSSQTAPRLARRLVVVAAGRAWPCSCCKPASWRLGQPALRPYPCTYELWTAPRRWAPEARRAKAGMGWGGVKGPACFCAGGWVGA